MDFDQAPVVKAAMSAMIERGDLGYNNPLIDSLVPAWNLWLERHHGMTFPESQVRPYAGVLTCLEHVLMTCSEPGDGVVIFSPIYPPFRDAIERGRRTVVDVPLGDGGAIDVGRFGDAIDDRTRVVLVSQPHNPIGRIATSAEIIALAEVVVDHDLIVVSDEIWADLAHEPARHLSLVAADPRLLDRTVTTSSASKSFSLSGLKCAIAHLGPERVRRQLEQQPIHLPGGPSTVSAAAHLAAWTQGDEWLATTKRALRERREQVASRLGEAPEIGFTAPEATYLAWLDLRATSLGDDPADTLRDHAGVALSGGRQFGTQGIGHARLNFATTEAILDEILDRIITAVRKGIRP